MSDNITSSEITSIESHLKNRGLDPSKTQVIIDTENNIATFLLYNLSGQIVGFHRYNPSGDKKMKSDSLAAKYFTWVTKESDHTSKLAVWGTENISSDDKNLFVTEGVFDAIKIKNAGYPVIAVLSNNPKILKSWLPSLNKKTIAVLDNDEAGSVLKNITDTHFVTPAPFKDLGEMSQEQVNKFLSDSGFPPKSTNTNNSLQIKPIETKQELAQVKDWILNKHYIKRWPTAVQAKLGVYVGGKLSGVLLYGATIRPQSGGETFTNDDGSPVIQNNQMWELLRAYTTPEAKQQIANLGSMAIAQGNEFIRTNAKTTDGKPVKAILTYADSDVGHSGGVYKATNASYLGKQTPKPVFVVTNPKTSEQYEMRTMTRLAKEKLESLGLTVSARKGTGKHKYVYALGKDQNERDQLLSKLAKPLFDYPKDGVEPQQIPNAAKERLSKKPIQQAPQKKSHDSMESLLNSTIKNPETQNDILVKTALGYDKQHPAYKAATGMIQSWQNRNKKTS